MLLLTRRARAFLAVLAGPAALEVKMGLPAGAEMVVLETPGATGATGAIPMVLLEILGIPVCRDHQQLWIYLSKRRNG
ncbi:MAG: hypothetical protein NT002_10965 [candidate division Zixibacteria bacterium]|nr:hypothetical protein [candidate division Zixibacteria bacterium]